MSLSLCIFFSGVQQQAGRGGTRRDIRRRRLQCGAARGGRWGRRMSSFIVFVLSTLLFSSHHFFPSTSFSVDYTTGEQEGTDQRDRRWQRGTGRGGAGRHDRYVFCYSFLPTLLFSSSHFYYLFCRKLQQQMRRRQVGRDRTGQRGDSNAGRGAGGRVEEVGEGRKAG